MPSVTFDNEGLSIHGTLALPTLGKLSSPGVIIFHGMTSSQDSYAPLAASLAEDGIAALAISMRGHGKSGGDFQKATVAEAISDGLAAYDFLASQRGVNTNQIGLVGSSVGAILAALTSSQRPVKSLLFRAPAAYTREMMEQNMAEIMVNEEKQFHEIKNLGDTPAGSAIAKSTAALMVVASENDTIIPLSISRGYVNLAKHSDNKQLLIIEGASHNLSDPRWKEIFNQTARDWFTRTLVDSK